MPDPANPAAVMQVSFDLLCMNCRYNLRGCPTDAPCPECGASIADTLASVGQAPSLGPSVETDRSCIRCSYNLRGLPTSGKCPECGLAVEQSLRGFLLQFAAPEYLEKVHSGLSLVLNGILVQIVIFAVGMFLGVTGTGAGREVRLLLAIAGLVPAAMILLGYWRYTEPDPGFVGTEVPVSARKYIRVAVMLQVVGTGLEFLFQLAAFSGAFAGVATAGGGALGLVVAIIAGVIAVVAAIAWLVQFFANMRYTRWVAARVPDQRIINRTRTYMWLLPLIAILGAVVLMLGPLVALVMYWNLLDRLRKHVRSIRASGVPAAV
ncbi:MAG: hypothetical protein IT438_11790 [Phycisphaerales bacterium]|nr:hypothetical protein [Phycisphaerales bacterium]